MMFLVLTLLLVPVSATTAGVIVWAGHRDESLDDGALVRNFVIAMAFIVVMLYATSRTNAVRMRFDPPYRIEKEIKAEPVYLTLDKFDSTNAAKFGAFLGEQMSSGATMSQALALARPWLTNQITGRLGFTDQDTKVMWGHLVADSLEELQAADPQLCYGALSGRPVDPKSWATVFSTENSDRFRQAVVAVYESADRGMGHNYPAADRRADHNEVVTEYRAIQADIEQQFGHEVAAVLESRKFPESTSESAQDLCSARIAQLDEMLKRSKPVAASLIDAVLR